MLVKIKGRVRFFQLLLFCSYVHDNAMTRTVKVASHLHGYIFLTGGLAAHDEASDNIQRA